MSHGFCDTPDAVNNDVLVGAAEGSHHPPNPWPWPTRGAGRGTSCRTGREGYKSEPYYCSKFHIRASGAGIPSHRLLTPPYSTGGRSSHSRCSDTMRVISS